MSTSHPSNPTKKRKQTSNPPQTTHPPKKPCADGTTLALTNHALIGPHESIVADLSTKHSVLAASIISSTQIRKRVVHVTSHLLDTAAPHAEAAAAASEKPRVVLLHARTASVCKMITVVEQCKRALSEKGKAWYQYNQLFESPEEVRERKPKKQKVDETTLEKENEKENEEDDEEDDAFEPMQTRFENAVLPPPRVRIIKSLRVFLSLEAVPELSSRPDVTVQTSSEEAS
ncbi:hypothetical protein PT974_11230 [Cladobotryum mycophilum]|uniref:DNA/RNA-binding protein Alba-like domain-containing protein n=1 Tax=Cladobotryum mycophilum TaxID=491253 RepID=A0ABR0S4N2_9HYPO